MLLSSNQALSKKLTYKPTMLSSQKTPKSASEAASRSRSKTSKIKGMVGKNSLGGEKLTLVENLRLEDEKNDISSKIKTLFRSLGKSSYQKVGGSRPQSIRDDMKTVKYKPTTAIAP